MAARYVNLPLYPDPYYQYSIALEGNSYILEFIYNERMELYTLSIKSADDEMVLAGVGLVPSYPIGLDYVLPDLSGFFLMVSKSDKEDTEFYKQYPDQIHQYYDLLYAYDA